MLSNRVRYTLLLLAGMTGGIWAATSEDPVPTKFLNRDGIKNTRHNLTQNVPGIDAAQMNSARNDYGEICVYCHTPHGANTNVPDMPLWNRTSSSANYTTYDNLGTSSLTQTVTSPGANSLTCLSCHDGTIGIDSIVNMPGPGRYDEGQKTAQNNTFLDTWPNPTTSSHTTMGDSTGNDPNVGCMVCHSSSGTGTIFPDATSFSVFVIGVDLTNDHPIGITFPVGSSDFNQPTGTSSNGKMWFFDTNGNGRANTNEIRLYDTGDGFEVECASCHDPHGVPSAGPGSQHLPTFLRVSNDGSGVCLTCHIK